MPASPKEVFDQIVADARSKVEARQAQEAADAARNSGNVAKTLNDVASALPKLIESQNALAERIKAVEAGRPDRTTHQSDERDPYDRLKNFGMGRDDLAPVIEHEASRIAERKVNQLFEEKLGPTFREAEAIQKYQEQHPDFDPLALQSYLRQNPDVQKLVQEAISKGAYETGLNYGETRRAIDTKISAEARAQGRAEKRRDHIAETRGDAAVLGGTAPNGDTRNPNPGVTLDQASKAFAHAENGDYTLFEKLFVHPGLPSEEEFNRIAQS